MKGKDATSVVKQMISVAKSKCMAIRAKTDAIKAQLTITALTVMSKKRKFSLGAISGKINNALDGIFHSTTTHEEEDKSMAIVAYNNNNKLESSTIIEYDDDDNDEKYPDLRHSLFDEEDEKELVDLLDEDPNSSVIDQVMKNSKENGESFNLEDEIDEVADMFITRFHKRMRLQKLLSFKRHQQMMDRSTA